MKMSDKKVRLDLYLAQKGFTESREKAKALIEQLLQSEAAMKKL